MKRTEKRERKTLIKKLQVQRQHVRKLTDESLAKAHGGYSCRITMSESCPPH